jgi:hypothetical protein
MKHKCRAPFPIRYLLCLHLLVSGLSALPFSTYAEEEKTPESSEADETDGQEQNKSESDEEKIESGFPFTFNDVASNLVIIECKSTQGKWSGSGFVAEMDGKIYIFTNQHVLMGADSIEFKTATGDKLNSLVRGVELAADRDIARLPLADRTAALTVSSKVLMGMPLAVFGNSEGGGVATELFGKVTGVGGDLVEVSAEFVSGNSGSPVINENREVIGIASYVSFSQPNRTTENTRFENQTRRFCYRLTNVTWAPVPWKYYNAKYGTPYAETVATFDSVLEIIKGLYEEPYGNVSQNYSDADLERWSTQHNRAITGSGNQRRRNVGKSAEALSDYCQRRARTLEIKLESRELSGFLRDELESYQHSFEYIAELADYLSAKMPSL